MTATENGAGSARAAARKTINCGGKNVLAHRISSLSTFQTKRVVVSRRRITTCVCNGFRTHSIDSRDVAVTQTNLLLAFDRMVNPLSCFHWGKLHGASTRTIIPRLKKMSRIQNAQQLAAGKPTSWSFTILAATTMLRMCLTTTTLASFDFATQSAANVTHAAFARGTATRTATARETASCVSNAETKQRMIRCRDALETQ